MTPQVSKVVSVEQGWVGHPGADLHRREGVLVCPDPGR